ncbi:hypothetical protein MBANPS3_010367 [Mucor bainieri]
MEKSDQEKNPTEVFKLFDKWAELLPKEGDQMHSGASFSRIGSEIKQHVSSMENKKEDKADQGMMTVKPEVVNAPKEDLKPNFLFELKRDGTNKSTEQQLSPFECVYDFCLALEKFCKSKSTAENRLDIDEDWKKLLFTCCSHNTERVMWIHLTFQTSIKMKLTWKQVVRRLMANFDDPKRILSLEAALSKFNFMPELESIYAANMEFARYADELGNDTKKTVELYLNGMPPAIKEVLESTIAYDESTHFRYSLLDIQQRSATFLTASEGDLIFYSKSAHLALALEYEKVDTKNCEFHLLADHSTIECPDYTVLRFPYMDFTPLTVGLKPAGSSIQDTTQPMEDVTMEPSSEATTEPVNASPVDVESKAPDGKLAQQATRDMVEPRPAETTEAPAETVTALKENTAPPAVGLVTAATTKATTNTTPTTATTASATPTTTTTTVRDTVAPRNIAALGALANTERPKDPRNQQKQPAPVTAVNTSATQSLVKPQPTSNVAPVETPADIQKTPAETDPIADKKQRARADLEKASAIVMSKIESSPMSPTSKARALAKQKETIDKMLANHERLDLSGIASAPQQKQKHVKPNAPPVETPEESAAGIAAQKKDLPTKDKDAQSVPSQPEQAATATATAATATAAATPRPFNAQLPPRPPTATTKVTPVSEPKQTEQAKTSVVGQAIATPSNVPANDALPKIPTGPAADKEKELTGNQAVSSHEKILSTTLALAQKKAAVSPKPQAIKISVPSNSTQAAAPQANPPSTTTTTTTTTSQQPAPVRPAAPAWKNKYQPSAPPRRSRSRSRSPTRRSYKRHNRSRSRSYSRSRSRSRSRSSDRSYYRSKSPPRRRRRLSTDSPPRRSDSPETGCYIHGIGANHSTKDCRQAQLVIQPRKLKLDRQPSPPPIKRAYVNKNGYKSNGEPNICIFCGLIFKPGHLQFCTKVIHRKKTTMKRN